MNTKDKQSITNRRTLFRTIGGLFAGTLAYFLPKPEVKAELIPSVLREYKHPTLEIRYLVTEYDNSHGVMSGAMKDCVLQCKMSNEEVWRDIPFEFVEEKSA